MRVFTIGHSTRTLNEFIALLNIHDIDVLVDVRSFTHSLANSQFNGERIETEFPRCGIQYVWLERLGGMRKGLGKQSKNTCWKSRAFRNYADYMETPEFRQGVDDLLQVANEHTVTIMCAEVLYWRCHRSMIGDFLKSRGVQVVHILGENQTREHEYNQCAKVRGGILTYHD